MKKRVLLIMPDIIRYCDYQWVPTSLLFLATVLKSKGYSPFIIDDRIQSRERTWELIDQNINDALLIGSNMSCGKQSTSALEIIKYIKSKYSHIPLVVGGPLPSVEPETVLSDKNIDYVISGQGEYAVSSLCKVLEAKNINMFNKIPHLYFKKDGKIIKSKAPFKRININDMPPLSYNDKHILDISKYINPDTRAINYNTSVGCIGRCSFCYWPDEYCFSRFSDDRVISDLKYLIKKYNLRNITFDDPIFFIDPKITMRLVERMIKEKLNVKWRANARVDTLKNYTSEDVDLLIKSGCHLIHIGMESGSERILDLMNKNISIKDGIGLVEKFIDKDIYLRFHFILGVPTEELIDIKLTADFIKNAASKNNRFDYTINIFTPYPGNKLTVLAEKYGYIPPKALTDYTEIDILTFKEKKGEQGTPLPSMWDIDYKLPWFSKEFNKKHIETFHKLIPKFVSIVSVDNKKFYFDGETKNKKS